MRAPVTRGYFFLLGALRLVNAASPRNIDQKKISSGTQGTSAPNRIGESIESHLKGRLNGKDRVFPDCIYFVESLFRACVLLQQTVETSD